MQNRSVLASNKEDFCANMFSFVREELEETANVNWVAQQKYFHLQGNAVFVSHRSQNAMHLKPRRLKNCLSYETLGRKKACSGGVDPTSICSVPPTTTFPPSASATICASPPPALIFAGRSQRKGPPGYLIFFPSSTLLSRIPSPLP